MSVAIILLIMALVCFIMTAISAPSLGRVNWLGLGLTFCVLAELLGRGLLNNP